MMKSFENHGQWGAVKEVCEKLTQAGYRALLAGGCVRDMIMSRAPNDFDIATDARPEAIEKLFPKALTVGREFGVTILPFMNFQVEVATFRKDGPYLDGRRPSSIEFSTPEEDAARRDFTVNALFFDIKSGQVLDFVGGQDDIRARIIRTVGKPEARFEEDKLRLLRAVRFAAQLDFMIAPTTLEAVRAMHDKITQVSAERVRDEFLKLLKTERRATGLSLLRDTGLLLSCLPEFEAVLAEDWGPRQDAADVHEHLSPWEQTLRSLEIVPEPAEPEALLTLFFLSHFKLKSAAESERALGEVKALGARLRLSNAQLDPMLWVYRNWDMFLRPEDYRIAVLARALAHEHAALALLIHRVDAMAADKPQPERDAYLARVRAEYLTDEGQLPERLLSGDDLKGMGVPSGKRLGELLEEAYSQQIEKRLRTRREAEEWVRKRLTVPPLPT